MSLPELVEQIAEVIGRQQALRLIGKLPQCGKRSWRLVLYVPKNLPPDHDLVRWLGWHDAQKMARAFGGECLQVPKCLDLQASFKKRAIREMAAAANDNNLVAMMFGISTRWVTSVLKEAPPVERVAENDNSVRQHTDRKRCHND